MSRATLWRSSPLKVRRTSPRVTTAKSRALQALWLPWSGRCVRTRKIRSCRGFGLGCGVLVRLCSGHPRNCARAGAAGAIDAVLKAASVVECSGTPALRPLEALGWLSNTDASNAAVAVSAGAFVRVGAVMRANPALPVVQHIGCFCIRALAEHDTTARSRAFEADAIGVMLAASGVHSSDRDLSASACCALAMLYNDEPAVLSSARACELAGATVRVLLNALDTHRGDVEIQSHACVALHSIASTPSVGQVVTGAHGAGAAVIAALRAHPGDAFMQSSGIAALAWLYGRSAEISSSDARTGADAAAIAAAGALELVLAAMGTHLEHADVQRNACFALIMFFRGKFGNASLAMFPVAASQRARVAAAVVAAMHVHAGYVQGNGVNALDCFAARSAANLASARAAGAVEAVVRALNTLQRGGFANSVPSCMAATCVLALHTLVAATALDDPHADAAQDAAVRAGAVERIGELTRTPQLEKTIADVEIGRAHV